MESNEILSEVLLDLKTPESGMKELKEILKTSENSEYTFIATAYRVCRSYKDVNQEGSWEDFCSNLRQYQLYYQKDISISDYLYEKISSIETKFNIKTIKLQDENRLIVRKDMPDWMIGSENLEKIYNRESMRKNEDDVMGDPHLYNMTGYENYRSKTQKLLMDSVMNMPCGSTLLGCMATGEGKSLVSIMPQFYEAKGLTIVIVPTVSLAIDQLRSSEKYFEDRKNKPAAYHSKLRKNEKKDIYNSIELGDLPILYISPEGILNKNFKDLVLKSAEQGLVNRLVIDEAHIIEDWGGQFRTEFQFLSVFRRLLLDASKHKLKTLLLSATFTKSTTNLLKKLFSEEDNFIEIRGDSLRPESQYYIKKCKDNFEKLNRLKEVIYLLPRPLIIYVIRPDSANYLKEELNSINVKSISVFTGEINNRKERETIIKEWVDNDIDIIIATSAFGMGVDKKDVRTVLHYSIPESINRFYQEVGRGGRDGISSISLMITNVAEDLKESYSLISGKIMTIDKFINRWSEMYENRKEDENTGNYFIDARLKPKHMEEDHIAGNLNISWNENVILTLFKEDLLDILDLNLNISKREYLIKLKDTLLLTNPIEFRKYLNNLRERELKKSQLLKEEIGEFIKSDIEELCIGRVLSDIYKYTRPICNGCNYCTKNNRLTYIDDNTDLCIEVGQELLQKTKIKSTINYDLIDKDEITYYYKISNSIEENIDILAKLGLNHIILKDNDYNLGNIEINKTYLGLSLFDEIKANENIISGIVALYYSKDSEYNQNLLLYSENMIMKGNKIIHLCNSEDKLLNGESVKNRTSNRQKYIK